MSAKIANRKKKHKIFAKYFPTPEEPTTSWALHTDSTYQNSLKSSIITDTGHSFRESYNSTSHIQSFFCALLS